MDREEAKEILKRWLDIGSDGMTEERLGYIEGWFHKNDKEAFDMAIKALEQEPILDKIRAEIEAIIEYNNHNIDDYDFCSGLICARNIIDKYRKE